MYVSRRHRVRVIYVCSEHEYPRVPGAINPVCTAHEIRHKSPWKNVFWRLSRQVDPGVEKWRMQIFGDPLARNRRTPRFLNS